MSGAGQADGEQRRTQERAAIEVEVNLESEHNFYSGITGNVSTGGLFVATYTPPPMGAVVQLALTLGSGGTPYALQGRVCWVRGAERASEYAPAGCGIRWEALTPEAESAIKAFVDRRDTIFYDEDEG